MGTKGFWKNYCEFPRCRFFFRRPFIAIIGIVCYNNTVIFKGVIVLNSPFHTEAPEKVRSVPETKVSGGHHSDFLRSAVCIVLFLALLAALVWGCYDVYKNPQEHYPLKTVNTPEAPADAPSSGQSGTQTGLQPVTQMAANTGATGTDVAGADAIVARMGEHHLTNQEFIYYYWDSFFALYDQLGSYLSSYMNFATPFDQQLATDSQTWHEYLSTMALENWKQTTMLCDEAQKNGYVLSDEDQAYLDDSMASLTSYAEKAGYDKAEGYLYHLFDPCADLDSYYSYNRNSVYASCYANDRYQAFYDEVYDPNAAVQYCVNVRHILLQPGEGEDMSAALTQAENLYEEWKQNPTEDNFIALAGEHTTDPGSQSNGGLYEDVSPGQMVTNFNDWCFDESRQPGDHGIVETEYGYHIMYFVGNSDTVYSDANDTATQEQYTLWLDDLFAGAQYVPQLENVTFTQKAQ